MSGNRVAAVFAAIVGLIYSGMVVDLTVITVRQHRLQDLWGFAAVAGSFALIALIGAVVMWNSKEA